MRQPHVEHHKSGSVRARGQVRDGQPDGYWEWFRLDGTRLRSGFFVDGRQWGEWTTYDRAGDVHKVTSPGGRRPADLPGPSTPVDDAALRLPAPAVRGLRSAGLATLGDAWTVPDAELLAHHGVGPKAVVMLRDLLSQGSEPPSS